MANETAGLSGGFFMGVSNARLPIVENHNTEIHNVRPPCLW
jgi:hypothetical protein